MEYKTNGAQEILAGITPIKTIRSGILLFAKKDGPRAPKNTIIEYETLSEFEDLLGNLIAEILDKTVPFKEKESTSF